MKPGWEVKALGEVASIINGGTPKSEIAAYWDGDVDWLTPKDMGKLDGHLVHVTPRRISREGLAKCSARQVPAQSVIMSTRAPIGHLAINTVPMAFNQGCRGMVPGDKLDAKFLFYVLSANVQALDDLGTGTTFKELSAGSLKSFRIALPPLDEQKRIVAVLDAAFDGLSRARAHTETNLQNARELFESFAREVIEDCQKRFETRSLADISDNLDRRRVPITKSDRVAGEVPYYGASGVVDYVAGYLFDEGLLLISEDGANLLARTYPIAFSISGKTWVNNHAHILRFADRNQQEFVSLYLNSISIADFVSGMAQPKLNQQEMNRIPIPLPDPATCSVIISKSEALKAETTDLQSHYRAKLADLDALRQALLQKAFAGELT